MKTLFSVLAVVLILTNFSFATAEVPVRSSRSVRQQFDSYTELLQKEIAMSKDKKQKFQTLTQAVNQMKSLRGDLGEEETPDTSHMDLVISSLESLPSKKEFKKKNCDEYQSGLPSESGASSLALEFLNSICE